MPESNDMIVQEHIPSSRLQKVFEQHGNEFVKWNFLPFLSFKERQNSRISCKILKRFIPPPKFVYLKTLIQEEQYRATARLDKNTGYVETRGYAPFGGHSQSVAEDLQSNVVKILATYGTFAALKKNGKVVTWGFDIGGDSSSVTSELQSDVVQIFSTNFAFAALNKQGKIICWGPSQFGGDSSSVSTDLQSDVVQVVSTNFAFAALNKRGKIICWGYPFTSGSISSDLESDVTHVVGNRGAFAALKSNGKVICWGNPAHGGNSSHLSSLNHGVTKIEVEDGGFRFRATKNDGTVIEWP